MGDQPTDLADDDTYLDFDSLLHSADYEGAPALCPACREKWTFDESGNVVAKE